MRSVSTAAVVGLLLLAGNVAGAENFRDVIAARQGLFYILEYNLGILEDIGADTIPYDRDMALRRAENIKIATMLHQDINWLPDSVGPGIPRTFAQNIDDNRRAFKGSMEAMVDTVDQLLKAAEDSSGALANAADRTRETCTTCHRFAVRIMDEDRHFSQTISKDTIDLIRARRGQFFIMEHDLNVLEDMANRNLPYERDIAAKRAQNIQSVTGLHQDLIWASDSLEPGLPYTRAWVNDGDREAFGERWQAMKVMAGYLVRISVDGPPMALGSAVEKTRATCNSCHHYYRPGH